MSRGKASTTTDASPTPDAIFARFSDPFRDVLLLLVLATVTFVLWRAWVCDDAFITFRYVQNCLAGYGPVFNVGERVQGFTHPLWFAWLLVASLLLDTYAAAIVGGLICTGLLVWAMGRCLRKYDHGALLLVAGVVFLLGSRSFVEFQTSGLETPLADLLVVLLFTVWPLTEMQQVSRSTVIRTGWICSLLLVTRVDALVICGPVLAWSIVQAWTTRPRFIGRFLVAMLPVFAWYSFATIYYGTPLPNTAYAKVAFPTAVALRHGLSYLRDYAMHEPTHALAIVAILVGACVWLIRTCRHRKCSCAGLCLPLGVALHLAYVAWVGGDFMRGRFIVPALVASVVLGCRILGEMLPEYARRPAICWLLARRPTLLAGLTLLLAGRLSLCDFQRKSRAITNGIADEYTWYAGYWDRPRFRPPESAPNESLMGWVEGGRLLDRYSRHCGPITIVWGMMGILPYCAGPDVSVIDTLGLTDAFTARCPADPASRVGHIGHEIPREYYRVRGVVNTLADSLARLQGLDSSLVTQASELQRNVVWSDPQAEQLWRTVQLVTTGPIFSWERLKAIPAYAFPHRQPFNQPSPADPWQ